MAEVTVNTLASNTASVAKVDIVLPGFATSHTGTSKKHPNDSALPGVGEALALARALRAAAENLEVTALERTHYWNG